MKRKSLEDLFSQLKINVSKKTKHCDKKEEPEKLYSQEQVNKLLENQQNFLFDEFSKYLNTYRITSELNSSKWTTV